MNFSQKIEEIAFFGFEKKQQCLKKANCYEESEIGNPGMDTNDLLLSPELCRIFRCDFFNYVD